VLGLGIGQVGLGAEGGEGRSVVDMGEGSGGDGYVGRRRLGEFGRGFGPGPSFASGEVGHAVFWVFIIE